MPPSNNIYIPKESPKGFDSKNRNHMPRGLFLSKAGQYLLPAAAFSMEVNTNNHYLLIGGIVSYLAFGTLSAIFRKQVMQENNDAYAKSFESTTSYKSLSSERITYGKHVSLSETLKRDLTPFRF